MTIKNEQQLQMLQTAGAIVRNTLYAMACEIAPGITTRELDEIGAAKLEKRGAESAPKTVYGFPGATCISLNNEAAHGVPGSRKLKEGDIVNIDVSASFNGYFADTGASFEVGNVSARAKKLLASTRAALWAGIRSARADTPLSMIGRRIERRIKGAGFSIIENLSGHGVGGSIHEEPAVLNFYHSQRKQPLHSGLVIAIEPVVSTGPRRCFDAGDGWTLAVPEGHLCAQFEHSIVVTKGSPIVLTA